MGYNKETKKYEGYIYKITNNINNKVYIGQTTQTVSVRFKQHINDARTHHTNMYIHRAIEKYGSDNFSIEELYNFCCNTGEELLQKLGETEQECIKKYNSLCPNGYNLTKGGDSSTFECHYTSKRSRKVYMYDLDGNYIKSFDSPTIAAREMGIRRTGINQSANKEGVIKSGDHYWSFKKKDKIKISTHNRVAVDQYDLYGNFIISYDCVVDALRSIGKEKTASQSSITNNCKGKTKHCYSYVWRFHGGPFDKYPLNLTDKQKERLYYRRKIDQYDLRGNYINTFNSCQEAARALHERSYGGEIARAVDLNIPSHGYLWCIHKDK